MTDTKTKRLEEGNPSKGSTQPEEARETANTTESKNAERWQPPQFPKAIRYILIVLANTITFLNFASGVSAIVLVALDPRNVLYTLWGTRLILLAIIFDFSDGIPARLAQKEPGFFGTVVDSVADAFSFGLAPGVIIALSFSVNQLALAIPSIIIGAYFGFSALFRLIRFTLKPSKKWFRGIPAPGAGCAAAVYIIIKLYLEEIHQFLPSAVPIIGLLFMGLIATLMIVTFKYPTTKLKKNFLEIFLLGLAAVVIFSLVFIPLEYIIYPAGLMMALTCLYVFYGPFYVIRHMINRVNNAEEEES
ncbi:MAG: hypothetical protein GF308_20695 [Candidatus Heimdallarchaeota archaeon]|nr:hypothetical protein [Candidatus Heimdallarchaeota archaeon]